VFQNLILESDPVKAQPRLIKLLAKKQQKRMRGWCSEVDGSSNKQNRRKRCAKDRHTLQGMYYLHNRLTHQAQCLQEWHEVSSNALCNSTSNVGLNAKIRKVEGRKRACIKLLSIEVVSLYVAAASYLQRPA